MRDPVKLSQLLPKAFDALRGSPADPPVTGLYHDSRNVAPGGVFFALRGEKFDGHEFVEQAVTRGAAVVVAEKPVKASRGVIVLPVADTRKALAEAAAVYYGDPTADMQVVGVTGTNGKTTTTWLLESVVRAAGKRPAVIGTINYRFADQVHNAPHTTPEAVELMSMVREFRDQGADSLVMEVSSHALEQHRVDGVHYQVGVFTNLTPEHLDYHGGMENYYAGKKRLFSELLPRDGGRAVINLDDAYGRRLVAEVAGALTFGCNQDAAVHPLDVTLSLDGIRGRILTPQGELVLDSPLVGQFNLENLLGAIAAACALDIAPQIISRGIAQSPPVPGRLERIANERGAVILVDYAHTGDALEKALQTVRQLQPQRILTVFGCGGDRDRSKRPVMGDIAVRWSDLVFVTSDNPRSENPLVIIDEILVGCRRAGAEPLSETQLGQAGLKGFWVEPDRRRAITLAVSLMLPGDVLLVAGKGHEDYQIVGTQRFHFDDREEVRRALKEQEVG